MVQAGPIKLVVASQVWLEDHDVAWIDGEVLEIEGEKLKVKLSTGKEVSRYYNIHVFQALY